MMTVFIRINFRYRFGMTFFRIRKGRYLYRETRVRRGKKIVPISEYLGIVGNSSAFQEEQDRHYESAMRQAAKVDAEQRATFGETGQEKADREAKETAFNGESFVEATATASSGEAEDKE